MTIKYIAIVGTLYLFFEISGTVPQQSGRFVFSKNEVYERIEQDSTLERSIARGEDIYTGFCMQCHMANGSGVEGTFPPLAQSDYLLEKTEESIRAVKYGVTGEITVNGVTYNSAMPKPGLYDSEIADVMNYILNSWGNEYDGIITENAVSEVAAE